MPERDETRVGRVVQFTADLCTKTTSSPRCSSSFPTASRTRANLAFADIVVAGGLGLQSAENYQLVRNLADVLGAEWGGSRPLVQKGWIPSDRQIGQTGKTIRPKLYIAAGISGAIQHRVGVEGADLHRRDQHRQERADLRFRAYRHRRPTRCGCCRR